MRVVLLAGGVGGARLAQGLAAELGPEELTLVVNTGDDFDHWGLRICPDLDTVTYTLAGLAPEERGWGREAESFALLETMRQLGGDGWFLLGDRDLALHLLRTQRLAAGQRLTEIAAQVAGSLGVAHRVLPATDERWETRIATDALGELRFQDWLVLHRAVPAAKAIRFAGSAVPTPEVIDALTEADLIIVAPSNPFVSIAPMLALPGFAELLRGRPVVGVSPVVNGRAVKGPLVEMFASLQQREASAAAVADWYGDLVSAWVVEQGDEAPLLRDGRIVHGCATVMGGIEGRRRLACEVLAFSARSLR